MGDTEFAETWRRRPHAWTEELAGGKASQSLRSSAPLGAWWMGRGAGEGDAPHRGRTGCRARPAVVWGVWAPHLRPEGRRLLPRLLGLASPSPKPRSFPPAEGNRGTEGGHPGAGVCPGPTSNTREVVGWSPQLRKTAEEQSLPGRPPSPLALRVPSVPVPVLQQGPAAPSSAL